MKKILIQIAPSWFKAIVTNRKQYFEYVIKILTRKSIRLYPPPWLHSVGSPDFLAVGEEFFQYFKDICHLQPHESVLDIGCGTGRMARPLAPYLINGRYEGMDIVAPSIKWCEKAYNRIFQNSHFQFSDIRNTTYNPNGKHLASDYIFPFPDSSFDFVFLTSVFTHMLPADMENYLSEISRVLKPNGRCLITYFLLNSEVQELIKEGKSFHKFAYELDGCRVEFEDAPENAVAYDESYVRNLYSKYGFSISNPIHYGSWCNRKDGQSWQDMVFAIKVDH